MQTGKNSGMLHTLTSSVKNDGTYKFSRCQGDRVVVLTTKLAALFPFAKSKSSRFDSYLTPALSFLLCAANLYLPVSQPQVFGEELTPVSPRQFFDK